MTQHHDAHTAMLNAALAMIDADANGWMPIETAPKDGVAVLLFYKSIGIAYGQYDFYGTADWWITQCAPFKSMNWTQWYLDHDEEDPTHWQPLPKPPVQP